ncbi:MAG: diguanylate cyclase [Alphaproteobacteria bacterium]|nr:diguanylate cyclase [Alphaproteobacteria bacterium]
MPLEYNATENLNDIMPVLGDHLDWYNTLQKQLLYPQAYPPGAVERLASFHAWFHKAQNKEFVDRPALDALQKIYYQLHEEAERLIGGAASSRRAISADDFEKLNTLHLQFCSQVRAYEHDSILEDGGLDALTGVRNWRQLRKDLKKELDRLERSGKSFTVAMTRIDQYEEIIREYSVAEAREYLKLVASLMKQSLRTFDDAYRTQEDKFALCLRQADMSGGISALERLKELLEEREEILKLGGRKVPLTLSCCIAEPVPEQDVDEMLRNLNDDLDNMKNSTGTVLEYFEISPLQKFIETSN